MIKTDHTSTAGRFTITSGDNEVNVMHFKNSDGSWETPLVSSIIIIKTGLPGEPGSAEMITHLIFLVAQLNDVLVTIRNAQSKLKQEYAPPELPFPEEFMSEGYDFDAELELYKALARRNGCTSCGGHGLVHISPSKDDEVVCGCAIHAEAVLGKYEGLPDEI